MKQIDYRQLIIDQSKDLIWIVNSDFQLVYANKSYFNLMNEITGKVKELNQSAFVDGFGEKDIEKWKAYYKRAFKGESFEVEGQFFNPKSNEIKYSQTSFEPIWDGLEIIAVNCQSRDITEKIPQNEKVIERQKRFESLIENSLDCVLVLSAEGKPMYVSSSVKSILGYTPEEAMEMNIWELCHPEDVSGAEIALRRSLENPGISIPGHVSRARHKNGSWRWIEPVITNLLHDPAVMGIVDNFRDITDKIEEQRKLNLFKSALTHANDAILITETDTINEPKNKIIYVNESFTKMTGYSLEDLLGKSPKILQGPNSVSKEITKLKRAIKKTESCEITTINYKKNGEEYWVNLNITPVANEFGRYTHWIAIERDVTERKFKEIEKEILTKISLIFLQDSNKSLSEYLTNLCEEVNQIGGFSFNEVWLPSIYNKTINRVANHVADKLGKAFYNLAPNINSFTLDEKMSVQDWQNQTIEIWDDSDSKWKIFERKVAATKAGIKTLIRLPILDNGKVIGRLLLGTEKTKADLQFNLRLFRKLGSTIGKELSRKKLEIELEQIFNFTPDLICVTGFDGYIKKINPAGLEIIGYSLEEILDHPITEFIHEEDKVNSIKIQNELYDAKHLKNFENRFITKHGEIVWLNWAARSSKEHGVVYAVAKNVSEEKKLRELNRQVGKLAKTGSWEVNLLNQSVFWSEEVYNLHEADQKTFVPTWENAMSFYREDFKELVFTNFEKAIATNDSFDFEAVLITTKKKEIWVRVIGNTKHIDGVCVGVYGSFQYINDRKQAEVRLQSITDNLPGVVFQLLISPNGEESLKNITKGAQQVWGFSSDAILLNNQLMWENLKTGGDYETVKNSISKSIRSKTKLSTRFKYILPNGKLRTHSLNGTPVLLADGSFLFDAIILDITDEVKLENLLKQASQLARIGSWEIDLIKNPTGENMYWSPMVKQIFEVDESSPTKLKYGIDFFIDESKVRIQKAFTDLIQNGIEFDEEFLLLTNKGYKRWVRVIGKTEKANNKCVKVYGSIQDIDKQKKSELKLKESENRLSTILNAEPECVKLLDKDGKILMMNPAGLHMVEAENEYQVIGEHIFEILLPEYQSAFSELIKSVFNGNTEKLVFEIKGLKGTKRWLETHSVPLKNELGEVVSVLGVSRDITEQIRTNQKTNSLQTTLENSLNEIYIFDSKTFLFSYVNKGALNNLGYTAQEMKVMTPLDIKSDQTLDGFNSIISPLLKNQREKVIFFSRHRRKDGSFYPVEVHLQFMVEGSNKRFLAVILDISERKIAEYNIIQANDRFEKVTEATKDVIWDWDIANQTFYRSKAIESIIGKDDTSRLSIHDYWKDYIHQNDLEKIQNSIKEAISNPQCSRWEAEYRMLNGLNDTLFVIDRGIIIRDQKGRAKRMVGAMTDVTDQKQLELKLNNLNKVLLRHSNELERSNEQLEQFAYVASHDLQEPLRMVTSFMDLLKSKYGNSLDEKALQYINFATDGAKRMRQIILDLLDYSSSGKLADDAVSIDLNEILNDYKVLRRKVIAEKDVIIESDILPIVSTYKAPITQTIHCLIDNAIKYSKEKVQPKIEIRAEETHTEWIISIQDNGIGIESDYFEKIFVIFQRLHNKDQFEGTGIGLAIAKKNVEACNGRIWVDSSINEGSTFYFTLNKKTDEKS